MGPPSTGSTNVLGDAWLPLLATLCHGHLLASQLVFHHFHRCWVLWSVGCLRCNLEHSRRYSGPVASDFGEAKVCKGKPLGFMQLKIWKSILGKLLGCLLWLFVIWSESQFVFFPSSLLKCEEFSQVFIRCRSPCHPLRLRSPTKSSTPTHQLRWGEIQLFQKPLGIVRLFVRKSRSHVIPCHNW